MRGVAILLAIVAAACAREQARPAFATSDCTRVSLVDAQSQTPVFGAEDLAIDAQGGRLFVSAYDRRAAERAARSPERAIPEGGLYSVALAAIASGDPRIEATSLVAQGETPGGLRPHGISFDAASGALDVINRTYEKTPRGWRMTPRLLTLFAAEAGDAQPAAPALRCAANDIARLDGAPVYSFDHKSCGAAAVLENIAGGGGVGVSTLSGAQLFAGARFANGLAALESGAIALAATREKALYILSDAAPRRIAIPAAPDNLSLAPDGAIIAATHPSLVRLALQRRMGIGRAGAQVYAVRPENGAARLLFEDRRGRTFSAASAAVMADGMLILGSPMEPGLLICRSGA